MELTSRKPLTCLLLQAIAIQLIKKGVMLLVADGIYQLYVTNASIESLIFSSCSKQSTTVLGLHEI